MFNRGLLHCPFAHVPLRFIRTHKPVLNADGERYKHRRFRAVCWRAEFGRELDQFSSELSQLGGELGQVFIKSYHYNRVVKGGRRGGLVGGCPNHESWAYFPAKWTSPQTWVKSSRLKKGEKRMQKNIQTNIHRLCTGTLWTLYYSDENKSCTKLVEDFAIADSTYGQSLTIWRKKTGSSNTL